MAARCPYFAAEETTRGIRPGESPAATLHQTNLLTMLTPIPQGMILLTLSVSLPALRPPKCGDGTADPNCTQQATSTQLGVFFLGLYILAVGTGGTKPNISTIGADQFDDNHPGERRHKLSFFNWWMFSIFFGTLFANTVLVYIQNNVGWTVGYALPTLGLAVSIAIFTAGTPFYRHKPIFSVKHEKLTV